jgi:TonB family protein
MGRAILTLLAATFGAQPLLASEPVVLAPSSPWNVDYGEEKCRLGRMFGEGEDKILLFMDQWGPDEKFGLAVAGAPFNDFVSRRKTQISLFDGQNPYETEPFIGEAEGYGRAVIHTFFSLEFGTQFVPKPENIQYGLPQIETAIAAQARYFTFTQGNRTVRLNTGPLAGAFQVLNQCSQQRLLDWRLDLEQHLAMQQMPVWKNEKRIAKRIASIYPLQALRAGESAILRMRVLVDEQGQVSDCQLYESTITKALDSPACEKMTDAEFDPALDATGKPMRSFYQTAIIYRTG